LLIRNIIEIDEELCDGCGQCIPNCAEGALQVIEDKAKLVKDEYCDGLGACLGNCPTGALKITQREADPFNEEAVRTHLAEKRTADDLENNMIPVPSALAHWPVQLNLVSAKAPFFEDSDLLVLADCVPVAFPNLHNDLLPGKTVVIGCPKFDDAKGYAAKLGDILTRNNVNSILVAHMEVPCCSGLNWVVDRAIEASGKNVPVTRHVVTVKGDIL
jgi:ferredoxin